MEEAGSPLARQGGPRLEPGGALQSSRSFGGTSRFVLLPLLQVFSIEQCAASIDKERRCSPSSQGGISCRTRSLRREGKGRT